MDAKQTLKEAFQFGIYKLDNNLCTPEEIESLSRTAMKNLDMQASVEDLAKFYGVPESKIRNTINRKMLEKPKRRVYYRFLSFQKIAPEKWRK